MIWSSLVDDPSSHPEEFPTEEEQNIERQRLFRILEKLVVWENSNNLDVLDAAKAEILKSTGGSPPALLDPFAGGGAIPLEAQRLGLEAHAHDLNPVAVMINKAMIEIPPKFAGQPPVHPGATELEGGWRGAAGLAEDVRYYGEWMKQEAFQRIGHLYPKVKDEQGEEHTVIAWIWARTVKCPNPVCGCEMPMVSSFVLSKKKGNEAWVEPIVEGQKVRFEVHEGKCPKEGESNKISRSAVFKCPSCGETTLDSYVKENGKNAAIGTQLMAVVAERKRGRLYLTPTTEQEVIAKVAVPENCPSGELPDNPRWFSPPAFGMTNYADLFTSRQLTALTTFSELVSEAQAKVIADGGSEEYGQAVGVYLAFVVDKLTDYHSSICSWHSSKELIRNTFGRQAIPMVWDYAEGNPFSSSAGCFGSMLDWVFKCIFSLPALQQGNASQFDAQSDCGLRDIMVSTDPPYYDNIGYADLSDFFYVWILAGYWYSSI